MRIQAMLLPVVYTPTVGEACQKFGLLPQYPRGCYISLSERGRVREVLEEYARAELPPGPAGRPQCDCIVFSDGGRILGLGDLAAWGMGSNDRQIRTASSPTIAPSPQPATLLDSPSKSVLLWCSPDRQARPVHRLCGHQPSSHDSNDPRRGLLRPKGQHRWPRHP